MCQRPPLYNLKFLTLVFSVPWKGMAVSAHLASPLLVETEDKKLTLFYQFLHIGCQQIITSIPVRARPPGLAALESRALCIFIIITTSSFVCHFSFFTFSPLFGYFIILPVRILWNLPCVLLFLIPDYFCILLFILIGSVFISRIFITKWHSLPLGRH